ncbi:uracil-DNA glycosylase [Mitsuaria sp. TWR114]|uniref:uracil-DNA glycosylase n=1 Tax=unclassified Roseateles TaxID=2626991 RepID=UPI0011BF80E2|nr:MULTISPECIES: uracil-DNA glycosylase [unclassified Roseateles]MBB3295442.1 uracil-DNA glycosylase [Mitsuaria sp. BK041]MBB3364658.1 uracil-DNA glycosylase [Mitsuaria sp. BK045]TXD75301.1 uracil-DNA glycosylase [Mitsuaria sp. TWR114]TXD77082.1 uracil-DNA glycosylase [Mitsuaria sp. TWR114]
MSATLQAIDWQVGDGWQPLIDAWRASADGQRIEALLKERLAAGAAIYPPDPLRALRLTPLTRATVVIVGQDPYHGPGQAEGLAFSVPAGQKLPPSLRNIFKELQRDLGQQPAMCGHLGEWARCGVLLLNTSLTVEDGAAASHAKKGWESLTDALIAATARDAAPKVFLLWGAHAQAKAPLIEAAGNGHLVLQANHPSPLSATRGPVPFIGCGHFSAARDWLKGKGVGLEWSLD